MKNNRVFLKGFTFVLAFVALLLCILAGMLHGISDEKSNTSITRVSVLLPHKDDGYWNLIAAGIQEAAGEISEGPDIDINMVLPQLNYNIPQMTELLKQQIAAKVDYIVVQGNEDEEFVRVLKSACEQGIQVICMDTDINEFPEHLYVGTDNYEAGRILGEQLVKLTGGAAQVAIISGEEQYQNLQQRLKGFRDAIEAYPEITVKRLVYDHYDGLTVMKLYQEMADDADALVCLEGTGGKTLESMYDSHGDEYEYVIGFDAYEGAQKRILDGVVKQDTNRMGHQIVEEICRRIETGAYSSDCIYTDIHWVTADNYDEVMK